MFTKKTERIDMHIWLSKRHAKLLDDICREYQISRPQVIATLLDDYEEKFKSREDKK